MKLGIRSLTGTGALALAILLCVSGPAALAAKDPSEQTLKETYQQQAAAPADTTNKDNAALYAEVQRANAEITMRTIPAKTSSSKRRMSPRFQRI